MPTAKNFNATWARLMFSRKDRMRIYAKLAKLLEGGVPLLRCLDELYARASDNGRKPNEPVAFVLAAWSRNVRSGKRLGDSIADWVPHFETMLLSAGDDAGQLPAAIHKLLHFMASDQRIRKAVVGGALYPTAILTLVLVYLVLFSTQIIPKFAAVVDPTSWKGIAYSLYFVSKLVQAGWIYAAIGVVAFIVTVLMTLPIWVGRSRRWVDGILPWSIYRLVVGSGFMTSMAALVSSGVPVERALTKLGDRGSPWLRERIKSALFGLKSGLNLGEAFRRTGHQFPSKEIIDDLCVYARFQGFDEALLRISDEWLGEGVNMVEARMKVISAGAIVILALVLMWIVGGFFGIQNEIANIARSGGT